MSHITPITWITKYFLTNQQTHHQIRGSLPINMTHSPLNQEPKIRALALYLEIKYSEASTLIDDEDWISLTDEEADDQATAYIEDSLWAFNYNFLCGYIPGLSSMNKEMWHAFVSAACEDANPLIKAMLGDNISSFVDAAIRADGRGHFISSYDSEEHEQRVDGVTYFLYQQN